jgi:hypothetical protein
VIDFKLRWQATCDAYNQLLSTGDAGDRRIHSKHSLDPVVWLLMYCTTITRMFRFEHLLTPASARRVNSCSPPGRVLKRVHQQPSTA